MQRARELVREPRVVSVALAMVNGVVWLSVIADDMDWPMGTVPDWIEALGTSGAFVATIILLLLHQRDQNDRTELLRNEQARRVAGYLASNINIGGPGPPKVIDAHIINNSGLPIRDVRAILYRRNPDGTMTYERTLPYGVVDTTRAKVSFGCQRTDEYYLVIHFDDDSGTRWEKYRYGGPALRTLS